MIGGLTQAHDILTLERLAARVARVVRTQLDVRPSESS